MRQIPTRKPFRIPGDKDDCRFINHNNDQIMVIKLDDKGNKANIQCGGVACIQKEVKGFVFKSFKSKLKWFNPSWWYKATCWGTNYPAKIYFNTNQSIYNSLFDFNILDKMPIGEERSTYVDKCSSNFDKASKEIADKNGIFSRYIIYWILNEIKRKTHIKFKVDFSDIYYGREWYEAYIPLRYKDESYLLTWQNCD